MEAFKQKVASENAQKAKDEETRMAKVKGEEAASKENLKSKDEKIKKAEEKATKADEKAEKNAAKMAALEVRFEMQAKKQTEAAGSVAKSEAAKDPKEAKEKQLQHQKEVDENKKSNTKTSQASKGF